MKTYHTHNSVYHVDGNRVMLQAGTPSGHLPFGEWVEVSSVSDSQVGERLVITYLDGKVRRTSSIQSIQG